MHQYKVLTQKDRFFRGKFDPERLETALNSYAAEGWKVVGAATAEIPSMGRSRQEMVVIPMTERIRSEWDRLSTPLKTGHLSPPVEN